MEENTVGVRVSITDQIRGSESRREIRLPKGLPNDLVRVKLNKLNDRLNPAVVGVRTVLEILQTPKGAIHQWKLTVWPHTETMLCRFLAETGTMINDGGIQRSHHANYNMVQAFEDAHRQVSDLGAPEPLDGTMIHLWFGYKTDGNEYFDPTASSLIGVARSRARIEAENDLRREARSVYFPFTRWKLYQRAYEEVIAPDVPLSDQWRIFHKEALGLIFARSFKPCLRSLWNAVYGNELNDDQLWDLGFPVEQIRRTVVSDQDLRRLIRAQNQAHRRTFVFIPE